MQVDPGFLQLTPRLLSGTFRGFQLLKLTYDKLLPNFAFNCNLRHYTEVAAHRAKVGSVLVQLQLGLTVLWFCS